ncbi:MAG: hypothetical protein ACREF0_17100, partial [Acetobacteraceae bacterium]
MRARPHAWCVWFAKSDVQTVRVLDRSSHDRGTDALRLNKVESKIAHADEPARYETRNTTRTTGARIVTSEPATCQSENCRVAARLVR